VSKRQGILDEALYNAPRNGNPFADDTESDADSATADPSAAARGTDPAEAGRELADAKA
jgi:hypothetical protein